MTIVNRFIARNPQSKRYSQDELISAGMEGLVRASQPGKFDPDLDIAFSTYAGSAIYHKLRDIVFPSKGPDPAETGLSLDTDGDLNVHERVPCPHTDTERSAIDGALLRTAMSEANLSPRQEKVLQLFLTGYTLTEIAAKFGVSPQAINLEYHTHIIPKLRKPLGIELFVPPDSAL